MAKMKIAICVNGRAHESGVTSYINTVADGFRELGHEVDIITIFGASKYREVKNEFVGKTDKFLEGSNIRTLIAYRISQAILFLNLYKNYLKKKYDVIYAMDVSVANIAKVIKHFHKVPVFLNVQSSIVKDLINQGKIAENSYAFDFIRNQEKKAYGSVDKIIANSLYTEKYIKKVNHNCSEIEIIRNVVNDKIFYPNKEVGVTQREELSISLNKFVILCVARLVKRKGVKYPLRALMELLKKDKDFVLIYAGEGEEKETLYNLISEYHLEDNVKILGNVSHNKINMLCNMADVVVIPSVTYKGLEEPLGIIALEAMATGIPVVASEIGGLMEIIKDGYNGILIPEKDYIAIAEAIFTLKESPELRNKFVENGLNEIMEYYTPIKVAEKLLKIFREPQKITLRGRG